MDHTSQPRGTHTSDDMSDYSAFRDDMYKRRSMADQNIVRKLIKREAFPMRPNTHFHTARSFTLNVFPNLTVINVEKPPCFLRKFSPDGRHFVAFSKDQSSIEVYEFQGPSVVEELLEKAVHGSPEDVSNLKQNMFERFFKLKAVVTVATYGEHLNRECSLFTDDGKFVIVGSATTLPDDYHPHFYDIYRNNESVAPNQRTALEDYTIHVVDLYSRKLKDSRQFKCDKIFLSHNQGIYLFKDLLAVLSVQHQSIHIFQVTPEGYFVDVRVIGRFCYDDDDYFTDKLPEMRNIRPFRDKSFNSLKQRLLAYLYRYSAKDGSIESVRRFYQYFDQFKNLRMWKMQLLDECHILIKYASEEVVTMKASEPNSQASFFVVYNMVSTEVISVYENSSEEFLELYEQFNDYFRNALPHQMAQFTCSTASNIHARYTQRKLKGTIISAKYGGHKEAVKRLLVSLPIHSQSFSSSPYLDLSLFSYDDKWVSVMERPRACGDHPIR